MISHMIQEEDENLCFVFSFSAEAGACDSCGLIQKVGLRQIFVIIGRICFYADGRRNEVQDLCWRSFCEIREYTQYPLDFRAVGSFAVWNFFKDKLYN